MDLFGELVAAIDEGNIASFECCLNLFETLQINITDRPVTVDGLTALGHLLTSRSCPEEMLNTLFRRVDINVNFVEQPQFGDSMEDSLTIPLLHLGAYCGNTAAVHLLCKSSDIDLKARSVHLRGTRTNTTTTLLHMAVKGSDVAIVEHILHKAHKILNAESFQSFLNDKDELGMTALHHAAWQGRGDIVSKLWNYQDVIDVNAETCYGFTALHLASWHNRLGVINNLLAHPQIDFERRSTGLLRNFFRLLTLKDQEYHLVRFSEVRARVLLQLFIEQRGVEKLFLQVFEGSIIARRDGASLSHFADQLRIQLQNFAKCGGRCESRQSEDVTERPTRLNPMLSHGDSWMDGQMISALHCAAFAGHSTIVETLVEGITSKKNARRTLNALDSQRMSPLHYAVMGGDVSTVEELSTNSMVRGNVKEKLKGLTPLDIAFQSFQDARGTVMEEEYKVIISLLSEQWDVKSSIEILHRDKEILHRERQIFVDAANAILVGAALIASITFAGWLQPPLQALVDVDTCTKFSKFGLIQIFLFVEGHYALV